MHIIQEDIVKIYIKSIEIMRTLWGNNFTSKNLNHHKFKYKDIHLSVDSIRKLEGEMVEIWQ